MTTPVLTSVGSTAAKAVVKAANIASKQVVVTTMTGSTVTGTARWAPGSSSQLVLFGVPSAARAAALAYNVRFKLCAQGHQVDTTNAIAPAAAHAAHLPWRDADPNAPALSEVLNTVQFDVTTDVTAIAQATVDADSTLGTRPVTGPGRPGDVESATVVVPAGTAGAAPRTGGFGETYYVKTFPARMYNAGITDLNVTPTFDLGAPAVTVREPDPDWRYGTGTE